MSRIEEELEDETTYGIFLIRDKKKSRQSSGLIRSGGNDCFSKGQTPAGLSKDRIQLAFQVLDWFVFLRIGITGSGFSLTL